ncbi:STAS domain-containing protein [Rickettsiales bacterium]|nr:STAS domain-containing protein [Rickettsiales bacterium]
MEYSKSSSGSTLKLSLKGEFTFADHSKFKEVIENVDSGDVSELEINLSELTFIDSAGLGLLLLLKDKTGDNFSMSLSYPDGQVKKMFEVSRFYELFNIIE